MVGTVEERLTKFKGELKASTPSIVRRFITFGDSYALDEDQHHRLKSDVADHFGIHPNEVLILGSAKLGFSIAPTKRYRPFGEQSDIDVALVSGDLFDRLWDELLLYEQGGGAWEKKKQFQAYLFRGWIRPDMLPSGPAFPAADDWWEFFRTLTSSGACGPYAIRAGVYRKWHHLERYQSLAVGACKQDKREGG